MVPLYLVSAVHDAGMLLTPFGARLPMDLVPVRKKKEKRKKKGNMLTSTEQERSPPCLPVRNGVPRVIDFQTSVLGDLPAAVPSVTKGSLPVADEKAWNMMCCPIRRKFLSKQKKKTS
jgi:hypothetical protein